MKHRPIYCIAISHAGMAIAGNVAAGLRKSRFEVTLAAPSALLARHQSHAFAAYDRIGPFVAAIWQKAGAIVFVGAAGIAVRAAAPCIVHKSVDPAVAVVDAHGKYVISLLSGHWGGGNDLARHIAAILGAQAVITTASDTCGVLALDLHLQKAGLTICDWRILPALQARLLEGGALSYFDPLRALPPASGLVRKAGAAGADFAIHWKRLPERSDCMRVAAPVICAGMGMRKNVDGALLRAAFRNVLSQYNIEQAAVATLATVDAKMSEPALVELAAELNLSVLAWPAENLARLTTPNPSRACGRRFNVRPFSVCEAAALMAAGGSGILLAPKIRFASAITIAIAIKRLQRHFGNTPSPGQLVNKP